MRQKTPKNQAIETLAHIRQLDGKTKEMSFLLNLAYEKLSWPTLANYYPSFSESVNVGKWGRSRSGEGKF